MPLGGSVTLAHTLPMIFLSFTRGYKTAYKASSIYSLTRIFKISLAQSLKSYIFSVIFDYVLPYLLIGLSSLLFKIFHDAKKNFTLAVITTELLRLICYTISGIFILSDYMNANLRNLIIYSVTYNLTYIIPNLVVSVLFVPIYIKFINVAKNSKLH